MTKFFTKSDDGNYTEVEAVSQTELDGIIEKRLERERSKYSDYDELKTKVNSVDELKKTHQDELKKATEKTTELETQLGAAKLETDKVKLLHEFKLSDDMAEFVTGANVEEMRSKAEKLSKGIPGGAVNLDKDGKPKGGGDKGSKSIAGELFGSKSGD